MQEQPVMSHRQSPNAVVQRSGFMDLPAEVRLAIYEILLVNKDFAVCPQKWDVGFWYTRSKL